MFVIHAPIGCSPRSQHVTWSFTRHAICAALPLLLWLTPTSTIAQAGANCVHDGTIAQTNACVVQQYQEADTAVQIYYGDVMKALSAHERPKLRQDQTNWQRISRQYCKRHHRSSELQPEWIRLYHECMIAQTRTRRIALSQWLHTGAAPEQAHEKPAR